jgi:hypothetical protein
VIGHIIPGVLFSGLLASGFGVGDGVALLPAGISCIGWLGDVQKLNVGDFLVNLASWIVVAALCTAVTYSLRRKEPHFIATPADNCSKNPFD